MADKLRLSDIAGSADEPQASGSLRLDDIAGSADAPAPVTGNAQANAGAVVDPKDPAKGRLPNAEQTAAIAAENARVTANAIAGAPMAAPLPFPLQSDQQQRNQVNEAVSGMPARRAQSGLGVLEPLAQGAGQIGQGVQSLPPDTTNGRWGAAPSTPEDKRKLAGGLHQIVQGGMTMAEPALVGGLVAAPIPTLAGLGTGIAAQQGTAAGLNALGVEPEYSGLAGDVAGLAAGGLVGGVTKAVRDTKAGFETGYKRGQARRSLADEKAGTAKNPAGYTPTAEEAAAASGEPIPPEPKAVAPQRKEGPILDATQGSLRLDDIAGPAEPEPAKTEPAKVEPAAPLKVEDIAGPAGPAELEAAKPEPAKPAKPEPEAAPSTLETEKPSTPAARGKEVSIRVPGEDTKYPAQYVVHEASDVDPSHNPFSWTKNPRYPHANDRDYSDPKVAAKVLSKATPDTFDNTYIYTNSPTAENGPSVMDQGRAVLGANDRTMAQQRMYRYHPDDAERMIRQPLIDRAAEFGLDPAEVAKFKQPLLGRMRTTPVTDPQTEITDYNKTGTGALSPEEQAVSDGKRLSTGTIQELAARIQDQGSDATLAQAIRGDGGAAVVDMLIKDGIVTPQQSIGMLDDRKELTGGAKERISQMIVGRLFESPAHFRQTAPELRNKLERIAPHVLRVEGRPDWNITKPVQDAVSAIAAAKAHGIKNLDLLGRQGTLAEVTTRKFSPEALAIAKTMSLNPNAAVKAFRSYANDETLSRDGAQSAFFDPPTQAAAFAEAFEGGRAAAAAPEMRALPAPERMRVTGARYRRFQATSHHLMSARWQEIPLPAADAKHSAALIVNRSMMELIGRAAGREPDRFGALGTAIHTRDLAHVGVAIAKAAADAPEGLGLARDKAKQIIEVLKNAFLAKKSMVFVRQDDTGESSGYDLGQVLTEEVDHAQQFLMHPEESPTVHLHQAGNAFGKDPLFLKARANLEKNGRYTFETPGHAYLEVGVRLMRTTPYEELGLSNPEIRHLAALYVRTLRKEYGHEKPKEIARRVFLAQRERAKQRPKPKQPRGVPGGSGQGGGSGPPKGDRADSPGDGFELRSKDAPRATRPDDAVLDSDLSRNRSLFDDSQNAASQAEAQANKDAVTKKQLTAQIKSGMAMPRKGGKAQRPESGSLFDDDANVGPPQGMLFFEPSPVAKILDKTVQKFHDEENPDRGNFSELGGLESTFVRNFGQLARADSATAEAAIRASSNNAVASTMVRAAVPQIEKALGSDQPDGVKFEDFRRAVLQSRLTGIADRFADWARLAPNQTKEQVRRSMAQGLPDMLRAMEGKRGLPQDLAQTMTALVERMRARKYQGMPRTVPGDLDESPLWPEEEIPEEPSQSRLEGIPRPSSPEDPEGPANAWPEPETPLDVVRKFLVQTFQDAADQVRSNRIMTAAEYGAVVSHPNFAGGLAAYKSSLEHEMAENHAINEGVFSNALGPLKTYMPLIPVTKAEQVKALSARTPYVRPANQQNEMATGLAHAYDTSMAALGDVLARAVWGNTKAHLIRTIQEQGLGRVLDAGEMTPTGFVFRGVPYAATIVQTGGGRRVIQNGKATVSPIEQMVMPAWLHKELEPILNPDKSMPHSGAAALAMKVTNSLNLAALAGPLDLVWHSRNILGTLVANTPFLENSMRGKLLGMPVAKTVYALVKLANTDPMTAGAAADLREMAKAGMLGDRYAKETYNARHAEQTGAELKSWKRAQLGPILNGPKGIDARARIVMYRLGKQLNPGATPAELRPFVNQLGVYVRSMQSRIERGLKSTGLAPFYTAGSTMNRNGVNAILGTSPTAGNKSRSMLAWKLVNGFAGAVALWYLAHKAYRGKWPHEEHNRALFDIPAMPAARRSALGQMLWGKGGEEGHLNFLFFNPLVSRGARVLGLKGMYDTRALGGSAKQVATAAARDVINSALHPALGPIPRAAFVGVTGREPSLSDLAERSGGDAPQFYPKVAPSKGLGSAVANRAAGASSEINKLGTDISIRGLDALFRSLGSRTGFKPLYEPKGGEKGNHWLRMAVDLAAPGLVGNASNPAGRAAYLRRQRGGQ